MICGACTLLQFTVSGLLTNSFTVFQPCILAQNGFSNTQLSALIEIRTVCAFLALFFVMGYYKKLGLKMGVALSVALTGAAFGLFALAGSFPAYCAAFALGGVAYTLGGAVPVALLLSAWFNDRGGLALGIAAAGTGINNIVASPLFTRLILGSSLRAGFLVQVLFCAAVALLLFFLLKTPRERGEEPYTDARSAGRAPVPGAFRMAIGTLIADGCVAYFSLKLGEKKNDEAARTMGNGTLCALLAGIAIVLVAEFFMPSILKLFGAIPSVYPYAVSYGRITIVGVPFVCVSMAPASGTIRDSGFTAGRPLTS